MGLAGPRKKQKIVIDTRRTASKVEGKCFNAILTEKTSSVALKLMAKMGWSSGMGLGKELTGSTDLVYYKIKDNTKGQSNVADDYEKLLQSLNETSESSTYKSTETTKEVKIKKDNLVSGRLAHKRRLLRGKNVKNYSTQELNEILGVYDENTFVMSQETTVTLDIPDGGTNEKEKKKKEKNLKDLKEKKKKEKKLKDVKEKKKKEKKLKDLKEKKKRKEKSSKLKIKKET
ncbi:hypothetical protein O9G_001711 [Rozella allomycis CSF55]|uniref:G-patch domain-containing protein n=1 Tax=Rozella allomycis (strain CSF55) TaxID=988480 RepID=A0A075AXM6_ROZAC|nr:hypothetical protein O9G_001711 [Rozella allomycis CSF55]|eukprot:EPZ33299.1 hypothetical protein O9G_001711 [Rozella allomycis CSF55]